MIKREETKQAVKVTGRSLPSSTTKTGTMSIGKATVSTPVIKQTSTTQGNPIFPNDPPFLWSRGFNSQLFCLT